MQTNDPTNLRRTTGVADNSTALEMRRMSDSPTASTPALQSKVQPEAMPALSPAPCSDAPAWETVSKIQGDLLKEQAVLIDQLTQERDEARNNLKTASAQWAQWRKELVQ